MTGSDPVPPRREGSTPSWNSLSSRLSSVIQAIKSQLMRVSVAIRATGSSAISRRQILARISQAKPGPFYIFLAQADRAGQACEAPDASSILAEDTFSSDSSMDRAAGYGPANEGSSPSPNTISSRRLESYLQRITTSRSHLARLPRLWRDPFIRK